MLRVTHVLPTLALAGEEILVARLCAALRRDGTEATVVSTAGGGPLETELHASGVPYEIARSRRGIPGFPGGLLEVLARQKPDLLHAHSGCWFPAAIAGAIRGIPVVYTEHGLYPDEPRWTEWFDRVSFALTTRLVVVSDTLAGVMADRLHLTTNPGVISNGVAVPAPLHSDDRHRLRRELGAGEGALLAGTIGRMVPVKDHATLLRAFATVADRVPAARLALIGDGPLRSALEAQAADGGFAERVCFVGSRADAARMVGALDVYVSSSTTEGAPMAILEAMAAGLPVVATAVGGCGALLGEGSAGVLVPPEDAGSLADAIAALFEASQRRRELGAAARLRVEENYSLDACARRHVALYRDVLRSAGDTRSR